MTQTVFDSRSKDLYWHLLSARHFKIFHSLNMVFIQCSAYLRVAFIYKLERIITFKLPVCITNRNI